VAGQGDEPPQLAVSREAQHVLRSTLAQHAGGVVSPSAIDDVAGVADLTRG
jgi:hypothetical protein